MNTNDSPEQNQTSQPAVAEQVNTSFVDQLFSQTPIQAESRVVPNPLNTDLPNEPVSTPEPAPAPPEPSFSPEEIIESAFEHEELDDDDIEKEGEEEDRGPATSIKNLRKITNATKKELRDVQQQLEVTKESLTKYESGEAVPEKVREYEQRINELERYEQLHNFRLSRQYRERYAEPLEQLKTEARQLAQEYAIDPSVLDKALSIENKKDYNQFLKKHFDDLGAQEAKTILDKIKGIHVEMVEAEKQPAQELERIKQEQEHREQTEAAHRMQNLSNTVKSGWTEALTEMHTEGEYPELQLRENDPEHNKYVQPILDSAAAEYGKFIKLLAQSGVKELPKDVAKILAKRFQLSQAAAVISASRAQHYMRAEDLLSSSTRNRPYVRPQVGSTAPGNGSKGPTQQGPTSPAEAADMLLNSVLQKP